MKIVQKANKQLRIQDDYLKKYLDDGYVDVTPIPSFSGGRSDDVTPRTPGRPRKPQEGSDDE